LKQITLRISKEFLKFVGFYDLFKYVERMEVVHIYRYDDNNMFAIQKFKFLSPEFKPEDLVGVEGLGITYVEMLAQKEGEFVCLVKTHKKNRIHDLLIDPNIGFEMPMVFTQDNIVISIIADEKRLKSTIEQVGKHITEDSFKILSISPVRPEINSIYSILTAKQLEILKEALKKGYYEIPRGVSAKELAEAFDISVSALNEHLRKAERKILYTIFKGSFR
jgi:predicted DNA binding protein